MCGNGPFFCTRKGSIPMMQAASNMQLKPLISFAPTKHLRSNCESQFDPRRLRRLTGGICHEHT
jgi:hypothetical protein